jgi:excisionase family DNA binding protein
MRTSNQTKFDHEELIVYDPEEVFENQTLTVQGAAKFLKCSTKTIYKRCADNSIPHKKLGTKYRFLLSELVAWMKER